MMRFLSKIQAVADKQQYKVVNKKDGSEVFFFDHSLKTAYQHMMEYVKRNKDKVDMELFAVNNTDIGPKWKKMNQSIASVSLKSLTSKTQFLSESDLLLLEGELAEDGYDKDSSYPKGPQSYSASWTKGKHKVSIMQRSEDRYEAWSSGK